MIAAIAKFIVTLFNAGTKSASAIERGADSLDILAGMAQKQAIHYSNVKELENASEYKRVERELAALEQAD